MSYSPRRNTTVFISFKVIPETYSEMPYVHYLFLFLNFVMWMSLYTASTTDPGFLPGDTEEYKLTLKQVRETKYISVSYYIEVCDKFEVDLTYLQSYFFIFCP